MPAIGQKVGKHRYVIVRGFSVHDKASGRQIRYGRGEPIPQEIIKDPDKVEALLRAGKLGIMGSEGLQEDPHEVVLSSREIEEFVNDPGRLLQVLTPAAQGKNSLRFAEKSLREIQRLLVAKSAPQEVQDRVQQLIDN